MIKHVLAGVSQEMQKGLIMYTVQAQIYKWQTYHFENIDEIKTAVTYGRTKWVGSMINV